MSPSRVVIFFLHIVEFFKSAFGLLRSLDVQRGKGRAALSNRQTIVPVAIVSTMFFVWGFAYGLLDIMNFHVREAMRIPREQAALLGFGYYFAYIPGPLLISGPLVLHCGYRFTLIVGLLLVALGSFFISIAAEYCSFPAMVASMFCIGCGVSSLERAANAYTVNCGPRQRATLRILFAQAMAGIGTVVAPFAANKFLFTQDSVTGSSCSNLGSVITLYRGVGGIISGLALLVSVLFFRTNLVPEVELHKAAKISCGFKFWKHPLLTDAKHHQFRWAAVANFFNMACQVGFAQFFLEYLIFTAHLDRITANQYLSVAQGLFVVGRFMAAAFALRPNTFKPRYVLHFAIGGALAFTVGCIFASKTSAIACAVLVMMFEGPLFPMIFESADVDLGELSSLGETVMIVSISGGAVQTPMLGMLNNALGVSKAWSLTAACFAIVWTYSWANNLLPSFREALDLAQCNQGKKVNEEEAGLRKRSAIPLKTFFGRRSTSEVERCDNERGSPSAPEEIA